METVACAELNPLLIQLDFCDNPEGGWAEVVCLDVAGSEVARCLFSDFEYMHCLYIFVASELSVPPMRLKFFLPRGSLHQIGTKWDNLDEILDIPKKVEPNGEFLSVACAQCPADIIEPILIRKRVRRI